MRTAKQALRRYNSDMAIQFEAVYEKGVLKPLRPLDLAENERVVVVIKDSRDESDYDAIQKAAFMERIRKEMESYTGPAPTLEEVRKITARDTGSWSDEIIASRGER